MDEDFIREKYKEGGFCIGAMNINQHGRVFRTDKRKKSGDLIIQSRTMFKKKKATLKPKGKGDKGVGIVN